MLKFMLFFLQNKYLKKCKKKNVSDKHCNRRENQLTFKFEFKLNQTLHFCVCNININMNIKYKFSVYLKTILCAFYTTNFDIFKCIFITFFNIFNVFFKVFYYIKFTALVKLIAIMPICLEINLIYRYIF